VIFVQEYFQTIWKLILHELDILPECGCQAKKKQEEKRN